MSEVRLARLGPEDWEEFRAVRLASLLDSPRAFGSRHDEWVDAAEERWRGRLTDVALTVVARQDDAAVGVVCGDESPTAVELISMWVAPGSRGTGLSRRLVDEVVAWAGGRAKPVFLMVRDDNVAAIRAYERAGFVDHGVPDDRPGDVPPERRMWHGTA